MRISHQSRHGFTLIEMLVVIGTIVTLAGLSYPLINQIRKSGQVKAASSLVHAVAAAIATYSTETLLVTVGGRQELRRIWDLNGDTYLDEDPQHPDAAADLSSVAPSGWRGFALTSGITLRDQAYDDRWAVIDPWKRPLRIFYAMEAYGGSNVGIASDGPDGVSTPDDSESDDVVSWR